MSGIGARYGNELALSALHDILREREMVTPQLITDVTMESLLRDVRVVCRRLWRTPAFTFGVIAILGLAIGATTLVFSIVNAIVLTPLPFGAAARLVAVIKPDRMARRGDRVSAPDFVDWKRELTSLDELSAYTESTGKLELEGEILQLPTAYVSPNWFPLLGVSIESGRGFAAGDDLPGSPKVIVLSDALWHSHFGADGSVVGRVVRVNNEAVTVIGVAAPRFNYPNKAAFWQPLILASTDPTANCRSCRNFFVIGRVRQGLLIGQARQEMAIVTRRLREAYAGDEDELRMRYELAPLRDKIVGGVQPLLLILFGAVVCVMVIACANVAILLLVRASSRAGEIGIRLALGAGRWPLIRPLLIESLLLALLGGTGGVLIATAGVRTFVGASLVSIPRGEEVAIDIRVLVFATAVTVGTGIVFGLVPALQATGRDIVSSIRSADAATGNSRHPGRLLALMVVAEVALAVPVIVSAGLLARSLDKLLTTDPGFRSDGVVRFDVSLPASRYQSWAALRGFTDGLVERLNAMPGTQDAAAVFGAPFSDNVIGTWFGIEGRPAVAADKMPVADLLEVTPRYFSTLRIRLRRGRQFTTDDRSGGHQVAIVNDALVAAQFPQEVPLGKVVTFFGTQLDSTGHHDTVEVRGEIVGIVGDTKARDLTASPRPTIYLPYDQASLGQLTFVVRSTADPRSVLTAARAEVASLDHFVKIYHAGMLSNDVKATVARQRLTALILGLFAGTAALLAAMGIYAVIACSVREREREIGIRRALGARDTQVIRLVTSHGLMLTGAGLVIGLLIAIGTSGILRSQLYEIGSIDVVTYAGVCVSLLAVAGLATWGPARRATRIDPLVAIRSE